MRRRHRPPTCAAAIPISCEKGAAEKAQNRGGQGRIARLNPAPFPANARPSGHTHSPATSTKDGRLAQVVEQLTLNQRVEGSSPSSPTILLPSHHRSRLRRPCGLPSCRRCAGTGCGRSRPWRAPPLRGFRHDSATCARCRRPSVVPSKGHGRRPARRRGGLPRLPRAGRGGAARWCRRPPTSAGRAPPRCAVRGCCPASHRPPAAPRWRRGSAWRRCA
jgi:hypothetical protein